MTTSFTRRDGILTTLFGTGLIGLRALATGLPAWYLLNPRRASAQDLTCLARRRTTREYRS